MTTTAVREHPARAQWIDLAEIDAHLEHMARVGAPASASDEQFLAHYARQGALGTEQASLVAKHEEFCVKCQGWGRINSNHARGLCYPCRGTGLLPYWRLSGF